MQLQGKNFLLPVDARLVSAEDVNKFRLMPLDDIFETLLAAQRRLVVLDAVGIIPWRNCSAAGFAAGSELRCLLVPRPWAHSGRQRADRGLFHAGERCGGRRLWAQQSIHNGIPEARRHAGCRCQADVVSRSGRGRPANSGTTAARAFSLAHSRVQAEGFAAPNHPVRQPAAPPNPSLIPDVRRARHRVVLLGIGAELDVPAIVQNLPGPLSQRYLCRTCEGTHPGASRSRRHQVPQQAPPLQQPNAGGPLVPILPPAGSDNDRPFTADPMPSGSSIWRHNGTLVYLRAGADSRDASTSTATGRYGRARCAAGDPAFRRPKGWQTL